MAVPVYRPVISVAFGTFRALGLQLDVRGREHVPAISGAVVAINHISYLDFALAGVPFWQANRRMVRFMAKQEVFAHPVAGPLMRGMRHIPVDRSAGAASYRAAVEALRAGELVGVFPEATISRSFCLKEFKTGAARMAIEAGVPILPVVLWGSQRVLTKGRRPDVHSAHGVDVEIVLGAPVRAEPDEDPAAMTERLHAVMADMLADAQLEYPPEWDGAPWWLPAHLGGGAPTPEEAAALDKLAADTRRARVARPARPPRPWRRGPRA